MDLTSCLLLLDSIFTGGGVKVNMALKIQLHSFPFPGIHSYREGLDTSQVSSLAFKDLGEALQHPLTIYSTSARKDNNNGDTCDKIIIARLIVSSNCQLARHARISSECNLVQHCLPGIFQIEERFCKIYSLQFWCFA